MVIKFVTRHSPTTENLPEPPTHTEKVAPLTGIFPTQIMRTAMQRDVRVRKAVLNTTSQLQGLDAMPSDRLEKQISFLSESRKIHRWKNSKSK
jgi:hypothetical protein